jgi:hypothetical protein
MYFDITIIYSIIIEILAYGSFFGKTIAEGFAGFAFAGQLFFELFVIALLVIIFNFIYQKIEDRHLKFELLVSGYKTQIRQTLISKGGQKHD